MKVILYSTNCPRCTVLEKKLEEKLIKYEVINDVEVMKEKGFLSVPVLDVDGVEMKYVDAIDWVNKQEV